MELDPDPRGVLRSTSAPRAGAGRDPEEVARSGGTEDESFPWDGRFGDPLLVLMGAESTLARWAELSACNPTPSVELLPDIVADETTVERREYDGCSSAALTFYVVNGGGHTWPGSANPLSPALFGHTTQDISASREIVDFFTAVSAP